MLSTWKTATALFLGELYESTKQLSSQWYKILYQAINGLPVFNQWKKKQKIVILKQKEKIKRSAKEKKS